MFTPTPRQEAAPAVLTVNEACATLHISRWTLYKLIRERRLDTIKIGRRRLIPANEISALIERLRGEEYF
jgi:excisionase family DNA binding protein